MIYGRDVQVRYDYSRSIIYNNGSYYFMRRGVNIKWLNFVLLLFLYGRKQITSLCNIFTIALRYLKYASDYPFRLIFFLNNIDFTP